jgi:hypothetical protein
MFLTVVLGAAYAAEPVVAKMAAVTNMAALMAKAALSRFSCIYEILSAKAG